jgi:sulfatase maturation enzyme AslB (radical SAM superfamily)
VRAAARAEGQRPHFGLTTNGSLCDEGLLAFLEKHRFHVTLSYDGAAQNTQRAEGSDAVLRPLIGRILESGRIRLETNSVFTPESVGGLSASLRGLIEGGLSSVRFSLSLATPWTDEAVHVFGRELAELRRYSAGLYRRTGRLPVRSLVELCGPRRRHCPAGKDRLAVDPRGRVWGCAIFSDWARDHGGAAEVRDYSFGRFGSADPDFEARASRVGANYRKFAIERSEGPDGPCLSCPDQGRCWVCPAVSALAGGGFHRIPAFICSLQRIKAREAARLAQVIGCV